MTAIRFQISHKPVVGAQSRGRVHIFHNNGALSTQPIIIYTHIAIPLRIRVYYGNIVIIIRGRYEIIRSSFAGQRFRTITFVHKYATPRRVICAPDAYRAQRLSPPVDLLPAVSTLYKDLQRVQHKPYNNNNIVESCDASCEIESFARAR